MILAFLSVALNAIAQLTLKSLASNQITSVFQVLKFWQLYATGAAYLLSVIAWFFALKQLPVGIAFPLQAAGYIIVSLGAWLFFGELVNSLQIAALALIVIGVVTLAYTAAK